MSKLAALVSVVALALAGYAAFKPAPSHGDTSALTVAAQYVHDLGVQAGVTIESVTPQAIREHGNTAIVREKVSYRQVVYGVEMPPQTMTMVVRLRLSAWSARYAKAVG